ncbi:hypothetical protein [Morganella psychrotolerans]|uniref:Uncharacterized protein n=1 Tax=Morganella psychrotolerans TaxID=368603 RepID=A0A1B8HNI6_9GAMM|nr:hypothetical protein [Morganella psychrotolerans]OBU10771.1 hypothetical protein AYY17_14730 [Morganella psychrotolerans]
MSEYRTEVTGSAVDVMKRTVDGKYQHIALIPLADIPARADAGEWDSNVLLGLRLIATYLDHVQDDKEKDLLSFRWMVAVLYIRETTAKNGMPYYRNHGVMLPLLPDCERIAMANHIEGAMTERHGSDSAEYIVSLYTSMIDGGGALRLSEWGTGIMDAMHEALTQDVAGGVLDQPELRTH